MQVMITSSRKERTPRSGVYKKVVNGEYIVVKKVLLADADDPQRRRNCNVLHE